MGSDSHSFITPAHSLVENGTYNLSEDSNIAATIRPPGYSVFLALHIYGFGKNLGLQIAVLSQIIMLCFASSIMFCSIKKINSIFCATIAQLVLLFNPNTLSSVFLIESDNFITFFVVLIFSFLLNYIKNKRSFYIILIGFLVGITALIKPLGLFFIPVFIPLFICIHFLDNIYQNTSSIKKILCISIIGVCIASSIVFFWMKRNYEVSGHYIINSFGYDFLTDQVRELSYARKTLGDEHWQKYSRERLLEEIELKYPDIHTVSDADRNAIIQPIAIKYILEQPLLVHSMGLTLATIRMYAGSGFSKFRNILGLTCANVIETEGFLSYIDSLKNNFNKSQMFCYVSNIFIPLFGNFILRVLGLIGIFYLIIKKDWVLLLVSLGFILIISFPTLHVAQVRYRVPMEPVLAYLAGLGLLHLMNFFTKRSSS